MVKALNPSGHGEALFVWPFRRYGRRHRRVVAGLCLCRGRVCRCRGRGSRCRCRCRWRDRERGHGQVRDVVWS